MRSFSRIFVGVLLLGAVLAPVFASAITADELRAQIASILSQVTVLQQKMAANLAASSTTSVNPVSVTSTTSAPATGNIVCPVFNYTLGRGARGEAVTALQKFLAGKGFLATDSATGFYGDLTESAVRNFQAQQSIVSSGSAETTGWGSVGRLTSAAIVRACSTAVSQPTATNPGACVTVPQPSCSGTLTANLDSRNCVASWKCTTEVTKCTMQALLCPTGQHYEYSASSYDQNGCALPPRCVLPNTSGAPVVTGVDGPASLNVGQQGTWTVHASVPNQPGAQIRYSVVWGDEAPYAVLQAMNAQSSNIPSSSTFTHAYSNAATYSPKFTVSNDAGSAQTSSTVSVGVTEVPLDRCRVYAIMCPAGQHIEKGSPTYDSSGCEIPQMQCVPDTEVPLDRCRVYAIMCPAGQHIEKGSPTYDSSGCEIPQMQCVADKACPAVSYNTDCAIGYHAVGSGTDANGCQLAPQCVADTTSSTFSASPISGVVPLKVTFSNWSTGGMTLANTYPQIDYGDGSAIENAGSCDAPADSCISPGTNTHTYLSAGTYTAKLSRQAVVLSCGSGCTSSSVSEVIGTATITVGANIVSSATDTSQNSNVASVLVALEAALKKFLGQ